MQPTLVQPRLKRQSALALYLRQQAPLLRGMVETHRKWSEGCQSLFALNGDPASAARARAFGIAMGTAFRDYKAAAEMVAPPGPALRCHQYWVRWLTHLDRAAQCLAYAPEDGRDLGYLRDCRDYLAEARSAAAAFNRLRLLLHDAARTVAPSTTTVPPWSAK